MECVFHDDDHVDKDDNDDDGFNSWGKCTPALYYGDYAQHFQRRNLDLIKAIFPLFHVFPLPV